MKAHEHPHPPATAQGHPKAHTSAHAPGHQHGHDHEHGHGHGQSRWSQWKHQIAHVVKPHSHDSAGQGRLRDGGLPRGHARAVDLARHPGRHRVIQAVVVGPLRVGGPARRHPAQRRRRADRRPAGHRVRCSGAGPPTRATPTATAAPRTSPGIVIVLTIAASAAVAGVRGGRSGCSNPREVAHLAGRRRRGVVGFVGNEVGGPLPDPRRPPDRLGRAGRRRAARPHRRLHLAGRAARRGRRRARLAAGPTRSSAC